MGREGPRAYRVEHDRYAQLVRQEYLPEIDLCISVVENAAAAEMTGEAIAISDSDSV